MRISSKFFFFYSLIHNVHFISLLVIPNLFHCIPLSALLYNLLKYFLGSFMRGRMHWLYIFLFMDNSRCLFMVLLYLPPKKEVLTLPVFLYLYVYCDLGSHCPLVIFVSWFLYSSTLQVLHFFHYLVFFMCIIRPTYRLSRSIANRYFVLCMRSWCKQNSAGKKSLEDTVISSFTPWIRSWSKKNIKPV